MNGLNRIMLSNAEGALRESGASCIVLFLDAIEDWDLWRDFPGRNRLVLVTQNPAVYEEIEPWRKELLSIVRLPEVRLTRLSQIKLSAIISITEGVIKSTDRAVFLSGPPGGGLDTMMVLDLSSETEVLTTMNISRDLLTKVKPEVLETVLNISLDLASEGREGRAIGTTFVLGDHEKVTELSRPLIMNPFKGYPEESRNVLDRTVHETIKEFSLLDGAFIIREDGVVMSAGMHLDAALDEDRLTPGLGCRHMAAAGITDVTDATAVTISGSTGIVRIFRKGKILLEIEKPQRGIKPA